jgi:hypothetical protein
MRIQSKTKDIPLMAKFKKAGREFAIYSSMKTISTTTTRRIAFLPQLFGLSLLFLASASQAGNIEQQIKEYRKTSTVCKKGSPPTDRCQKKLKMAYEGFEASYQQCLPGDEGMPMSATPSECAALEKFIGQEFVINNPSFAQVSKALKFINQRSQMNKMLKQSSL